MDGEGRIDRGQRQYKNDVQRRWNNKRRRKGEPQGL